MRAVAHSAAPPDPAPYAAAEAAFAEAKAYLCWCEARQMSESDLERELHRRGQELMRKLLQGHLDQRSPGEAAGPVEGADEVERSERRVHERHLETTFGTVVERLGYARPGHDSLHPLDAALNLPPERYSPEVRRRVAEAAASRSFDEALFDLSRSTGAQVPKRQAEQLVVRAAEDFDAFYEARRAEQGEPPPEGLDARAEHSRGQGPQGGGGDAACGDRRRLPQRHPQAGRYVRRLPAEIRAVSALRPLPRGGLSHCHRRDRRGVPVPGPRPDGVDRSTLAPGWRRGGSEAAGATSQPRLRCVLGLPRSARVPAELLRKR